VKILIVSWYFPPVNTIGALRVGKFARFLIERGHDIGVVAGRYWGQPETLPLGVPLARVAYAKSVDVNAPPQRVQRMLSQWRGSGDAQPAPAPATAPEATPPRRSLLNQLSDVYLNATNLPDNRIGWLPWANSAATSLSRDWRPDLIFGSAPPFTAFLACHRLSRRLGTPWIAELRDRWADDPYDTPPAWRGRLNQWLERRILGSAAGLVTVTEPWAEAYRRKYALPVATIYNGYDPLDFDFPDPPPIDREHLVIGYTGGIYPGRRDPTPLFAALHRLGPLDERFRVVFCGTDPGHVLPLADAAGVSRLVEVRSGVPYRQSLEFQRACDILLLMQWNDPREQGNCPGKFFEYLASLRPVLVLGLEDGVPATIVRERQAGFCANDPAQIAAQLEAWLAEKDRLGRVAALPAAARDGLSRTIQFEALEKFLLARSAEAGRRGRAL
jgi:glycosyltransferase involved in cell wall biosynthesis